MGAKMSGKRDGEVPHTTGSGMNQNAVSFSYSGLHHLQGREGR